jgi:hypothetical protein
MAENSSEQRSVERVSQRTAARSRGHAAYPESGALPAKQPQMGISFFRVVLDRALRTGVYSRK